MTKKLMGIAAILLVMSLGACASAETSKRPAAEGSVGTADVSAQTYCLDESSKDNAQGKNSSTTKTNSESQTLADESVKESEETKAAKKKAEQILNGELKEKSHTVDVQFISQTPELPTGCESVALVMALNAIGYKTEKTEIADNYMPIGDSYVTTFLGDPHKNDGAGIYPPGLVITAQNYIDAKKLKAGPVDLTDTDFKNLYKIIEKGYPIVFWYTINLNEPCHYEKDDYTEVYNGREYPWITNIHCVVMNGYDLDAGTVTFTDPISGTLVYDAERVEYIYDRVGRMAMTVIN